MTTVFKIQRILLVALFVAFAGNACAQTQEAAAASTASGAAASRERSAKAADRKLAHRVAGALARVRGLNSARILVKARDGRITLSGSVTDSAQIQPAVDAAKAVEGVRSVENGIRVSGAAL